jgi:hypothetical protein
MLLRESPGKALRKQLRELLRKQSGERLRKQPREWVRGWIRGQPTESVRELTSI